MNPPFPESADQESPTPASGAAQGGRARRNFAWLAAERALRLGVGLVINVWIIRALGPGPMGLLGFSQSLVGLFAVFAQLGLESILVRELVRRPGAALEIMGSGAAMRFAGAVVCLAGAAATVALLRPGDGPALVLVLLFGGVTFFQALEVIEYWLQSRSRIVPYVSARTAAFVTAAVLKVIALSLGAPLEWIAAAIAAEIALSALAMVAAYRLHGETLTRWRARAAEVRTLARGAAPMLLNSMAILLYSRTDQVMITMIRGDYENGLYAAAQRLSEVLHFVPTAALLVANPVLYRLLESDRAAWEQRLVRLFRVLLWSGAALALGVSLLSGPLTGLLFGDAYRGVAPILSLHVWAAPFVFVAVAQSNWFLAQRRERGLLVRSVFGAALNIGLNFVLIPRYGALGAAAATLLSHFCAAFLLNAAIPSTRPLFRLQLKALVPWGRD